jgi:DNA-binding NarL/FixJ family response regulator
LISTEPNLAVIAEAADGEEAIRRFESLRPDLVVMDLRMPGLSGHEVTRRIRQLDPVARVLMLSAFEGDTDIHVALEAGACGYVLKSVTGEELIPAIHAVAAGKRWIPREVATRLKSRNSFEELTARELDVLEQLSRGRANKEIADTLGITEYTTKGHLKSILAKLRVADRTQAVIAAVQRGIIHF